MKVIFLFIALELKFRLLFISPIAMGNRRRKIKLRLHGLIAQRTERIPPKDKIQVRFLFSPRYFNSFYPISLNGAKVSPLIFRLGCHGIHNLALGRVLKTEVFFDILIKNSMRGKVVTGERNERRDLTKGRTTYGNPVILHQVIR